MRYLKLHEVIWLHERVLERSGGGTGVRDMAALESAVAQPHMSFSGQDLYPEVADKAAALCYSLVSGHPFVDGNKRVGHAAMETFLALNGYELKESVDGQERVMLQLAAGKIDRVGFTDWVRDHLSMRKRT